jgi:2',3'-cyclic-nucleotide 2'-phosphodiesterase (5'-nucleotidase family)
MNQGKMHKFKFTSFIVLLISLVNCSQTPLSQKKYEIHIAYTGNLNGALQDCNCGGVLVGGMTRIITLVDSLREIYPDLLLLDGGDAFFSYSLPEANRTMQQLMRVAKYDGVNIGDQELVESNRFLNFDTLPYLSANLYFPNQSSQILSEKTITKFGKPINITAYTDPQAFSFIKPEGCSFKNFEYKIHRYHQPLLNILLFHGDFDSATQFADSLSTFDIVILGHNQSLTDTLLNSTIFLESGFEGEYLGFITININGDSLLYKNEWIPVTKDVPGDSTAQKIVDDYMQSILKGEGINND